RTPESRLPESPIMTMPLTRLTTPFGVTESARIGTRRRSHQNEGIREVTEIKEIPLPFGNVEFFVQEKWRIASARAGSGNTTNIGSITGNLGDFVSGAGVFETEDEFLAYWRGYGRTGPERESSYHDINGFRNRSRHL
ncbi:MAG: type II restriction endonuclease, partial [Negativicutes bacterium]|nr:type II restriction endonuclease [Negativicutes bacterium]